MYVVVRIFSPRVFWMWKISNNCNKCSRVPLKVYAFSQDWNSQTFYFHPKLNVLLYSEPPYTILIVMSLVQYLEWSHKSVNFLIFSFCILLYEFYQYPLLSLPFSLPLLFSIFILRPSLTFIVAWMISNFTQLFILRRHFGTFLFTIIGVLSNFSSTYFLWIKRFHRRMRNILNFTKLLVFGTFWYFWAPLPI